MDTTKSGLAVPDLVDRWLTQGDFTARLHTLQAQPRGDVMPVGLLTH